MSADNKQLNDSCNSCWFVVETMLLSDGDTEFLAGGEVAVADEPAA